MRLEKLIEKRRGTIEPTAAEARAGVGVRGCTVWGVKASGHGLVLLVHIDGNSPAEIGPVAEYRVQFSDIETKGE